MSKNLYYTDERNVQIVISLLKSHGIHKVIASPGTTNMTFIGSIQQDSWFEIYSSVDERSAAYLACGMAEESGEPVVLSCTGATASRNYMPGLTEAYYRKLPVLAITSHRGVQNIGHLFDQQIDRRSIPNDISTESVTMPMVDSSEDERYCIIEGNKAILALTRRGGGPAHINLYTRYSSNFSVKELPTVRVIKRYDNSIDSLPVIKNQDISIFIGSHKLFTQAEVLEIECFCEKYNAFVICDHTSGYHGKYKVPLALVAGQSLYRSEFERMDLLIHIGEVSGDSYSRSIKPKAVWRISKDGELRDSFGTLKSVFEMSEIAFFKYYNQVDQDTDTSRYEQCIAEYEYIYNKIEELPFGNMWIAKQIHKLLPLGCGIHFGILNSLRSWNFFRLDNSIRSNCNVGGFGIDGGISSLIGASLVDQDKLYFGVFGDLAFFYDMNVIGNRHVGNNVRILLINNGKGTEFRLSMHPCNKFGEEANKYMAAAGHYGNMSQNLVRHYSRDLGYKYLTASNKEEFLSVSKEFLDPNIGDHPIIFEIFTETENESEALDQILSIIRDLKVKLQLKIMNTLKGTPFEKVIDIAKKYRK